MALLEDEPSVEIEPLQIPDDRLRLMFTCCHPALARDAQVALTLQTLGGLTTKEIARAFLVQTPTMAQRLVRAKNKIKTARIRYEVPQIRTEIRNAGCQTPGAVESEPGRSSLTTLSLS